MRYLFLLYWPSNFAFLCSCAYHMLDNTLRKKKRSRNCGLGFRQRKNYSDRNQNVGLACDDDANSEICHFQNCWMIVYKISAIIFKVCTYYLRVCSQSSFVNKFNPELWCFVRNLCEFSAMRVPYNGIELRRSRTDDSQFLFGKHLYIFVSSSMHALTHKMRKICAKVGPNFISGYLFPASRKQHNLIFHSLWSVCVIVRMCDLRRHSLCVC